MGGVALLCVGAGAALVVGAVGLWHGWRVFIEAVPAVWRRLRRVPSAARTAARMARAWCRMKVTRPARPAHERAFLTDRERTQWATSVRCARRRAALRRAAAAEAAHRTWMRDQEGAE